MGEENPNGRDVRVRFKRNLKYDSQNRGTQLATTTKFNFSNPI